MRHTVFIVSFILFSTVLTFGQQPFKKLGYTIPVSTLSQGKYSEDFTSDSLVQVGSVILNRVTGKVVSFISYDTAYLESSLDPQLISRWMAPDPLSAKYYSWSPYNYVANNPIKYIDPDGRQIQISFANSEAKEAFFRIINNALEGQFKVNLTEVEGKDGLFDVGLETVEGGSADNLTKNGKAFYDNLDGTIRDTNLISIRGVYSKEDVNVGKYKTGEVDFADIEQFNPTGPDIEESVGATQAGKVAHEFSEQLERVRTGFPLGTDDGYKNAHGAGIRAENSVNGNTRFKQGGNYRAPISYYRDENGEVIPVTSVVYGTWGKMGTIKVLQPKPKGKIRKK